MNIILLSGGSGKRLWPLSNDTRSKQFLRLLKNEEGEYESMVQRVYRQLMSVCPEASIAVATGASQVDSIKNQLGSQVDIVIEPERRDTFPAIALSSAYLAYEKKVSFDEAVLVLPVDPFVEKGYFETLIKIEQAVKDAAADIILMGIKPSHPSEKFGYIVPEKMDSDGEVHQVARFTEKPTEEKAMELIKEGAVWNGGVFGFKLGYLMDILKQYTDKLTFQEILNEYGRFKKISFDYEVVEKAQSVAMVPYEGKWKDLGTWNALADELSTQSIGNAVLGEETEGTTVVNELSLPIVVLGAKNLIIAASPDGILVSDKEKSVGLKSYVESVGDRPMYEESIWGEAKVIDSKAFNDNKQSITRYVHIKSGESLSCRKHELRDEVWTFLSGNGELKVDGEIRKVSPGDTNFIGKGIYHGIHALTDLHFMEVQLGKDLSTQDVQYCE